MDINSNQYVSGAKLALTNAKRLFDSAAKVAEIKNYGCAMSIMVLSAEEASKAIGLMSQSIYEDQNFDVKKLFQQHKTKQELGSFTSIMGRLCEATLNIVEEVNNDLSISEKNKGSEFVKRFSNVSKQLMEPGDQVLDNFSEWRTNADRKKKLGFYVDFVDGGWLSPQDISKSEYEFTKFSAEHLIKTLESSIVFWESKESESMKNAFIKFMSEFERNKPKA